MLGDELVDKLTADQIRDWHRDLSRSLPMIPKKKTGIRTREIDFDDPDQVRKRQVSANRCMTLLKAALNRAFKEGRSVPIPSGEGLISSRMSSGRVIGI